VRLTIERLRTMVLAAGVLLVVALVVFLAIGKWKNPFNRRDLPQRLGLNIQQEANGWTYTHEQRGRTVYKIHASKLVQMKKGSNVLLHDVRIELYGEDGSRVDRIEGSEFEYDPKAGLARATGQVEITLMRPGVAPAIAPKATPTQAVNEKQKDTALAAAAESASASAIHVKTSGLTFDRNSEMASTDQRVEFSLAQGSGSAIGASYNSEQGLLVLDHAVELNTKRGDDVVTLRAQHAEFERGDQVCRLRAATAKFHGGEATAGAAKIVFRTDGSAVSLDATNGFAVTTATGGNLSAPLGLLEFDEHNQPRHGHLQGGVQMDSVSEGRSVHGSSPTVELEFTVQGALRHAHLERGVDIASEEQSQSGSGPLRERRTWKSPVADLDFRDAGKGKLELNTIHGTQGVVVTGESQHGNGPVLPSKLAADDLTGQFGLGSALTAMIGLGHARMEETAASGTRQTTQGDRLEAHFSSGSAARPAARPAAAGKHGTGARPGSATQIQSATIDGHVVLTQEPAAKPGGQASAMRATSGRAVYEEAGEWLHLTLSPRVEDGGLQLTADKIDVSQGSGDAFARGNVKASWVQTGTALNGSSKNGGGGDKADKRGSPTLGGQGPAHAVAAEAQLHQMTGEATFRGQARLWQDANSVAAPVIVLDRMKQTLVAKCTSQADPVRVVMVSAAGPGKGQEKNAARDPAAKQAVPTVIRMRGGDLKYSDAERKAVMWGGAVGRVVAETGTATVNSNEVELILLPPGNHAGKDGEQAQVDRMTARGNVSISSQGRRGTGEQLVYAGESGEYVLTGTASVPPRLTDPARGTVTGEALIFRSRDDSVSIEAGGRKTMTETTAPK
jgi:lipopolysaccharide export system protein LptA